MIQAPYPSEFRQQTVERVRAGRIPAKLSREFKGHLRSQFSIGAAATGDIKDAVKGIPMGPAFTQGGLQQTLSICDAIRSGVARMSAGARDAEVTP